MYVYIHYIHIYIHTSSWLILVPPFSPVPRSSPPPLQEDEFAGLGGPAPKDSASHHQDDLLPPPAKDASLVAARRLPEVDAALLPHLPQAPQVPQVLVRFCMS